MKGNPLNDPMISIMYENALQSLYAGNVMPFERQILAMAPLPDDVVDPYAAQDVDPNQIMKFAYKSLSAWIDEAKKACYLSKRFTDLSKLVLKGVNTMGRGLMTLHNRGEDLTQAPMQIGDLISVASYHFRKSYLGVMQTAASDPEVSERLLINQLSWTNMLLRLYKTKDRLEVQPSAVSVPYSSGNLEEAKLTAGSASAVQVSSVDNTSAFSNVSADPFHDVPALFEPSAISAPRALSAFGNTGHNTLTKAGIKTADPVLPKAEENSHVTQKTAQENTSENREHSADRVRAQETGNSEGIKVGNNMKIAETKKTEIEKKIQASDNDGQMTDNGISGNSQVEIRDEETLPDADKEKNSGISRNEGAGIFPEDLLLSESEGLPGISGTKDGSAQDPGPDREMAAYSVQDDDPPDDFNPDEDMPDDPYSDDTYPDDDLPLYLNILQTVFARGQDPENGAVTFTEEEMRLLTADSGFNRFYPETACEFRRILAEYDST